MIEKDMELVKKILVAIDEKIDGTNILFGNTLGIENSGIKTFYHAEILFKAGYISFFQNATTTDFATTFVVGGLTEKGKELINLIKNTDKWDIVKENINKNDLPNILQQHLSYYIPPFIDAPLRRYMSLDKLDSVLSTNSLYFCRAGLLGDTYEGSTTMPSIKYRPKFYEGATQHYVEEGIPEIQKAWRQCTYVSCWHNNLNESALMWRTYGENNKAISVQTTLKKLQDSILDFDREYIFVPINYIDYEKDYISVGNAFEPFRHKQKAYDSEREFRVIIDNLEIINEMFQKKVIPPEGFFINVNVKTLIESIIISPYSSSSFKNEVIRLLTDYNLNDRLSQSRKSTEPNF